MENEKMSKAEELMWKVFDRMDDFFEKISVLNLARKFFGDDFVEQNKDDICKWNTIAGFWFKILIVVVMVCCLTIRTT